MYRAVCKDAALYVSRRNAIRHYAMRVPYDARQHYAPSRISFSLITNSLNAALRTARRKAVPARAALNKWLKRTIGERQGKRHMVLQTGKWMTRLPVRKNQGGM
ncbi:MAG: DUF6538 domain-containing protein [Candidatus Puniceispirillaceae bacterium]